MNGSTASKTCWNSDCGLLPEDNQNSEFQTFYNESCGSVVRTYPYTHPQQLKVVIHLICISYWCGSHFEWVYSHKDSIMMYPRLWFAPQKTTRRIPNVFTMRELWYCGKDLSIYASTAYEGCETPFIGLILMLKPSWMGLSQWQHYPVVCSSEQDNQNST